MKKIDSIDELREQKDILRLKMKYTKVALGESVGQLRKETVDSVQAEINEKMLPLDLISDGLKLVCQFTGNSHQSPEASMTVRQEKDVSWYKPLIPVAVKMISNAVMNYFLQPHKTPSKELKTNGVDYKHVAVTD